MFGGGGWRRREGSRSSHCTRSWKVLGWRRMRLPWSIGWFFSRIWKCVAPSKVVAFSWKLLHNRIPTKVNLSYRNVLSPEIPLNCVMCDGVIESANHLMLHCAFAMKVWDGVMRWLGFSKVIPPDIFFLWECWDGVSNNKKIRKGLRMIWHAVVWTLWTLEGTEQ